MTPRRTQLHAEVNEMVDQLEHLRKQLSEISYTKAAPSSVEMLEISRKLDEVVVDLYRLVPDLGSRLVTSQLG